MNEKKDLLPDIDPAETREWLDSLESVMKLHGLDRAEYLLRKLVTHARKNNVPIPGLIRTHYINTILPDDEPSYPGDENIELKIRRIIRWNAVAMVIHANKIAPGVGGHLASYASSASLYEVGFNHFFQGKRKPEDSADQIYFQGHAAPGIYSRAYLEGRLSLSQLKKFRQECGKIGSGLSSYPHPRLMPDFWEFPSVSMGLGPISAIYQARFNKYLTNRGIKDLSKSKVWCFIGDGETDEVETIGAIDLARRENLDNLIFVINCNLQRLDGPVRGNSKVVQELEGHFRGMGWHCIKVLWGRGWDDLFKKDIHGLLVKQLDSMVDGEAQKYSTDPASKLRETFFGKDPRLLNMVKDYSDKELRGLRRGGHDYTKIYAAYQKAVQNTDRPTVILAQTVKGWALGPELMAKNIAHSKKSLSDKELTLFRDLMQLPISDKELKDDMPFYHPGEKSEEIAYLQERRNILGGYIPRRYYKIEKLKVPASTFYDEFYLGTSEKQQVSTTMAFVRLLSKLMRDKTIGQRVVPIIPDEARTFGMHTLFPEFGIYNPHGQLYEPVDRNVMLYYREDVKGQILEEGITEAGSMASLQAASTSYATHSVKMIPFYTFYSMFGLQRTGDQAWQLGDIRGRGFMMGATSGRTTLNGEGLQHQDGHSHILASLIPSFKGYDPAWAYELAVIIEQGLYEMIVEERDLFYYITLYNENYTMAAMPTHIERSQLKEQIIKGAYLFAPAKEGKKEALTLQLLSSGSIFKQAMQAKEILEDEFDIEVNLYSATSFNEMRKEAIRIDYCNQVQQKNKQNYIETLFGDTIGPILGVTDHVRAVVDGIAPWLSGRLHSLGTDGFGMSDSRETLREYFNIDYRSIILKSLSIFLKEQKIAENVYKKALKKYGIKQNSRNPLEL